MAKSLYAVESFFIVVHAGDSVNNYGHPSEKVRFKAFPFFFTCYLCISSVFSFLARPER
jgi:hypothetical protein